MSTPSFASESPATQAAATPAMPGSAAARGRASWSGLLQLSLVTIPVKAYPAASTSQQIHFNQLHAGCGQQRIRYEESIVPSMARSKPAPSSPATPMLPTNMSSSTRRNWSPYRPPPERAGLALPGTLPRSQGVDPALFSYGTHSLSDAGRLGRSMPTPSWHGFWSSVRNGPWAGSRSRRPPGLGLGSSQRRTARGLHVFALPRTTARSQRLAAFGACRGCFSRGTTIGRLADRRGLPAGSVAGVSGRFCRAVAQADPGQTGRPHVGSALPEEIAILPLVDAAPSCSVAKPCNTSNGYRQQRSS